VLKVPFPEESKHYGDPGAALFMWLTAQTVEASEFIERDGSETEAHERLDVIVQKVIARLPAPRIDPRPHLYP